MIAGRKRFFQPFLMIVCFDRHFSMRSLILSAERVCRPTEPFFMPAAICMNFGRV